MPITNTERFGLYWSIVPPLTRLTREQTRGGARGHLAPAGTNGHVKILRGDFSSEADATRAAQAELTRLKRGAPTFRGI